MRRAAAVIALAATLALAPAGVTRADPYNRRRPAGWTALTAALLVAGGGYYFLRQSQRASRDFAEPERGCAAMAADKGGPACTTLDLKVQRGQDLAVAGFVAGGTLAVLAMYLFATDKEPGQDQPVSLGVGRDAVAVQWSSRF